MKYLTILAALFFVISLPAQARPPGSVSTPQHIVVDSKDNVFVTLKYGMLKIAPDGTVVDLERQRHQQSGGLLDANLAARHQRDSIAVEQQRPQGQQ